MFRLNMARLVGGIAVLGVVLFGASACAERPVEQDETIPAPTGSTFVSPVLTTMVSPLPPEGFVSSSDPLPDLSAESGRGAVSGKIVAYPEDWTGKQLHVYLSPFYKSDQTDEGIYVLDPSIHPSTPVSAGGEFQFADVSPGRYVVIVGPDPEDAAPIQEGGRIVIFDILGGKVLEMGEVSLRK